MVALDVVNKEAIDLACSFKNYTLLSSYDMPTLP